MASKEEAKKSYQHFVPMAKLDPDWYKKYEFILVTSMEQLNQIFIDANWTPEQSFISFDTETTGLNFEELDLVGYSFSIDGKRAVYVPVNHFEYEYNLDEPAVEYIYQRMCEARQVFMYNARYDLRVFEYRGYKENKEELDKRRWNFVKYDMSKVNIFDVMNSVFDSDSNDKLPSLKASSRRFLGYEQMHFDEVIESAGNFYYLNPSENFDTVYYAAADALCTYLLVGVTMKYYQEAKLAGQLDNAVIYPLMHYESEKLWLDTPRLERMYRECEEEVDRLEKEVYAALGYQINLNSPSQVAQALERLGIDTGERTASGNMATGMKILEQLPKETKERFPALKSFLKYKEENKLLTTYFKVYLEEAQKKGYVRISYKIHNVPCLTESSYVNILGKGLVSIKEAETGDMIWTQYGYKKILWNNKKWADNVYTLKLKCGSEITGTGHHPVLVNVNGSLSKPKPAWTSIQNLEKEERIIMNSHRPDIDYSYMSDIPQIDKSGRKNVNIPTELSPELARFIGYMDGDGCIMDDRIRMSFNTQESEVISFYSNLMESIFYGIGKPNIDVNGNSTTYDYFSVDLCKFFREINSRQVSYDGVSKIIMNSAPGFWLEYLIGLWDTDGCLCKQTNPKNRDFFSPRVRTVKRGMMYDVNYMLQFLGVTTRMVFFKGDGGNRDQFEVRCDTFRGHDKFRDLFGNNLVQRLRKERALTNEIDPYYDLFQSRVKEVINENHGDWVYDIEVEDVHEYIANGIVTHNTGRLASGKDGKNTYFSPVNGQALPKPHVCMYDVYDYGDQYRNYFSKKDNVIMGYAFVKSVYDSKGNHVEPTDPRYIGWAEGMDQHLNVRSCITGKMYEDSKDDDWVYVACDYAAQELRLTANMSHEPVWENAFSEGRDVHRSTAEALWGAENYNKDYRKKAKSANFCECIGNLVLDSKKGYIPAESVKVSDILVGFNSNTNVLGVETRDDEPCIDVIFSSGIRASYHENHKLLCWNGSNLEWVRVKDIDDSVQIIGYRDKYVEIPYKEDLVDLSEFVDTRRNRQKYGNMLDKNSPNLAYLMGLYVGDGNIRYDGDRVTGLGQCVSVRTKEDVLDIVRSLGFEEESISCDIISNGNVALISYGGVGIARWVANNFGTPRNKSIPDWVFTDWSREAMLAFIAGYIDSDGTKARCGQASIICSTIPELLHRTALMCNFLGLRTLMGFGETALYKDGVRITEGKNGKFKDGYFLEIYDIHSSGMNVLNKYKVCESDAKKWEYSWYSGSKEDKYRNFINPIRESLEYKSGANKRLDNFIGNLRDGHTGPTEFNLREVEKVTDECPLKSSWFPVKIIKKKEFKGKIIAIECDTHEYVSMSMSSHNSIIYGAGASSFNDPFYDIHSMAEAEEFYENYKKALPTLFQWEERKQRQGRRDGTVYTYFGRPRRVKGYFDNGQFGFANRTIVNTQIQGTAADILKLVMVRLWKNLLNHPDYKDDVRFLITIHDEIGYAVKASRVNEIVSIIEENQTVVLKEWRVPIITEASIGWSVGGLFAWEKVPDNTERGFTYRPKLD